MTYLIYEPAYKAAIRSEQITEAAQEDGFLTKSQKYIGEIITHPTENKAALEVIVTTGGVYDNSLPIMPINFGVYFTAHELEAKAISSLPEDWGLTT